ncbi:MAG: hypothetical protein JWN80_1068 [Microbacteriaceae bacterium]|nr:hypothetical protein [Microbacteriaceae bacterium]
MENTPGRDDEVLDDFDETNGKVEGLEGDDDRPEVDRHGGLLIETIENAEETLFGTDDEDARSAEERDPAVTRNSEEGRP